MPYYQLADGSVRKDTTKLHPKYKEQSDYTPYSLPSELHPDVRRQAESQIRKAQGESKPKALIGDYKVASLLALTTTQKHVYAGTALSPRKAKQRAKQDRRGARIEKRRERRDDTEPAEVLGD